MIAAGSARKSTDQTAEAAPGPAAARRRPWKCRFPGRLCRNFGTWLVGRETLGMGPCKGGSALTDRVAGC